MRQNFTKAICIAFTLFISFTTLQAQTPFWSEDFSGGVVPADWTNMETSGNYATAVFTWCNDPSATGTAGCPGLWADGYNLQSIFASETAANGFITLNSDAVAATAVSPHISELTTGAVNCTGQTEVYFVSQNHIGTFDLPAESNAVLQVSNDGGSNWTDFTLFPGLLTGATDVGTQRWSFNPHIPVIDISAVAADQASVMFRFRWTAGWEYHWSIDDIGLYNEDPTNLFIPADEISAVRGAAGNNGGTPMSQIYPVSFLLDVANNGTNPATGVEATANIQDLTNGAIVYSETITIGDIDPLNVDDESDVSFDNIWPTRYTPPASENAYRGFYTVNSPAMDEDTSNDTLAFTFVITDSTFRKDLRDPGATGGLPGVAPADPDWTFGAGYYVPNGETYAATSVTFGISNAAELAGALVNISLYKWVDTNGNNDAEPEERDGSVSGSFLGSTSYFLTGNEVDADFDIHVVLDNNLSPGDPIMLENDAQYIVAVEMFAAAGSTTVMSIAADDDINYLNSWFVNDSLTNLGLADYAPQWGAFFAAETGNVALLSDFGFSPHIHLNINVPQPDATTDLDPANKIEVYPNPTSDLVTLDLEMVNSFDNVNIKITDVSGKSMMETNYQNVFNEKFEYNVSNYAAGTYFLHVTTEEGNRAIRFVVMK